MVTGSQRVADRERWWDIHDKDEYICPDCRRTQAEHGRPWNVHHLDDVPGKIVALCECCHRIRHGANPVSADLEAWKAAFVDMTAIEDLKEQTIYGVCRGNNA